MLFSRQLTSTFFHLSFLHIWLFLGFCFCWILSFLHFRWVNTVIFMGSCTQKYFSIDSSFVSTNYRRKMPINSVIRSYHMTKVIRLRVWRQRPVAAGEIFVSAKIKLCVVTSLGLRGPSLELRGSYLILTCSKGILTIPLGPSMGKGPFGSKFKCFIFLFYIVPYKKIVEKICSLFHFGLGLPWTLWSLLPQANTGLCFLPPLEGRGWLSVLGLEKLGWETTP